MDRCTIVTTFWNLIFFFFWSKECTLQLARVRSLPLQTPVSIHGRFPAAPSPPPPPFPFSTSVLDDIDVSGLLLWCDEIFWVKDWGGEAMLPPWSPARAFFVLICEHQERHTRSRSWALLGPMRCKASQDLFLSQTVDFFKSVEVADI